MRHDIALQTAVDTDGVLASQSTLCRFEQQADRDWAVAIHEEMIEQFIRSFRRPPKKPLYLDFDATDDWVHRLRVSHPLREDLGEGASTKGDRQVRDQPARLQGRVAL
ncbi:transposase [Halomonas meridiana]|nr:transposase [Halomonas meridiana]